VTIDDAVRQLRGEIIAADHVRPYHLHQMLDLIEALGQDNEWLHTQINLLVSTSKLGVRVDSHAPVRRSLVHSPSPSEEHHKS
jgi:hypothetical protein